MGRAADIVEEIIGFGHEQLSESLARMHPDAVVIPLGGGPPLHGREAIRDHVEGEIRRLGTPLPEPLHAGMIEHGDRVIVFGQLKVPHGSGSRAYNEFTPMVWVYEVRDDQVSRVNVYGDIAEAREAAGVPPDAPVTRRLNRPFTFAVLRRRLSDGAADGAGRLRGALHPRATSRPA